MFSFSPSELLTIGVIALIVFGPRRLPEIARRAGKMAAYLRSAAEEIKGEVAGDLGDVAEPFREAASDLSAAGKKLIESAEGELKWADEIVKDLSKSPETPETPETLPKPTGDDLDSEQAESP